MGEEESKFKKDDDDESDHENAGSAIVGAVALVGAGAALGAGLLKLYESYNKTEECHTRAETGFDRGQTGSFPKSRLSYPRTWSISKFKDHEEHFKPVVCTTGTKEYKFVEDLMKKSMPHANVKSIIRIENKRLYETYMMKKVQMERLNDRVNERHLFHGTKLASIDSICYQGFDFRLNGERVGTKYGQGIYFAATSRFSADYCELSSSGIKRMFLASVLVGKYTKGNSSYKRPPPLDNETHRLYDSCVDDVNNPSIFVIFELSQVYPEYLIDYN